MVMIHIWIDQTQLVVVCASYNVKEHQQTPHFFISCYSELIYHFFQSQEESGILSSSQSPLQSPPPAAAAAPEPSLSSETKRGKTISLKDDFLR